MPPLISVERCIEKKNRGIGSGVLKRLEIARVAFERCWSTEGHCGAGGDCDSAPCHSKMGLSDANQHRALVRAHPQLAADDIRSRPACQTRGVAGGSHVGRHESASLAVAMIGQGLALARGRTTKHAIKQVDRLLSNQGIDIDSLLHQWVPYVVGSRSDIKVAMDWTDFEADGQATIMLSLLTRHGRATPLVWLTVDTATLKDRRNGYEHRVLIRLAEVLPTDVKVCIVADRGFGDRKLYQMLTEELKFDFVIRFRGNIAVAAADGEVRAAADWVGAGGRARVLRDAAVTAVGYRVKTVVCVQAKDMKEPWCLAASITEERARALINLYAKRWGIECAFRDTKDLRFGMGMSSVHVSTPDRRDRLWLISALAVVLLTLLGTAGEALGYDRHLKTNTTKRRTHSLFRQGAMLYDQGRSRAQKRGQHMGRPPRLTDAQKAEARRLSVRAPFRASLRCTNSGRLKFEDIDCQITAIGIHLKIASALGIGAVGVAASADPAPILEKSTFGVAHVAEGRDGHV